MQSKCSKYTLCGLSGLILNVRCCFAAVICHYSTVQYSQYLEDAVSFDDVRLAQC